jgi:tetratricopeptide (TPR) repeat protein
VLVEANHPVAGRAGFAIETYKLALRAYVAVTPQQVDKAEATMDALEKLVQGAGDANAAENLTKIYVSLGRELEQQLQELRRSGQTKQLESVSKAFEIFLDRVTKRDSGNSYASLNWVGETYFSLGAGFDAGPGKTSEQAATYFAKAAEAYKHMLEVVQDDPKFKDNPESLTAVRLRLADCYRRAGNYDDAVSLLVEVLKQKPMLLPAQVQAAETLQARGASDPKSYGLAILGAQPGRDGRNTIWGWAKISNLTMNNEKFADTFHHARLKLVEARYQYAQTVDEASKRAAILAVAKQDLWITYNVRPELGGEVTVARYERLLKQIQGALGEKESGLQEFRDRKAAGTADATQP